LAHPFELALGGVLVANGARGFAGEVSPSLALLPDWLVLAYLVVSTIGGVGVITGLTVTIRRRPGFGVALERSALFLVAASYVALAAAILQANGSGGAGVGATLSVVAAACLLRAHAIRLTAKTIFQAPLTVHLEPENGAAR